ncbi:hypothetical protein FJ366_02715 [Candidatus Dependentiae bacterium]|nr:hypothetical protein [Candidatus Dependentiae bacterium]
MIKKLFFRRYFFIITALFLNPVQINCVNVSRASSIASGFLTGGPAGAVSSATGMGTPTSSGMIDEFGLDQSTMSQQPYVELAPGDIPMMSAAEADLYSSIATSAAGGAMMPAVGIDQDFGSLSPAITPVGSTSSYPLDPFTGMAYPLDPSMMPSGQPPISPFPTSPTYSSPAYAPSLPAAPSAPAGYSPGSSSDAMDASAISGTTIGGAAALGLGGAGGSAYFNRRRRQQLARENEMYAEGRMNSANNEFPFSGESKISLREEDVDFGEIFFDTDKNGVEKPQIKRASKLRMLRWSERRKLEYQLALEKSKLSLLESQKRSRGIDSFGGIDDKMNKIAELRRKIALLPPDKNSSFFSSSSSSTHPLPHVNSAQSFRRTPAPLRRRPPQQFPPRGHYPQRSRSLQAVRR